MINLGLYKNSQNQASGYFLKNEIKNLQRNPFYKIHSIYAHRSDSEYVLQFQRNCHLKVIYKNDRIKDIEIELPLFVNFEVKSCKGHLYFFTHFTNDNGQYFYLGMPKEDYERIIKKSYDHIPDNILFFIGSHIEVDFTKRIYRSFYRNTLIEKVEKEEPINISIPTYKENTRLIEDFSQWIEAAIQKNLLAYISDISMHLSKYIYRCHLYPYKGEREYMISLLDKENEELFLPLCFIAIYRGNLDFMEKSDTIRGIMMITQSKPEKKLIYNYQNNLNSDQFYVYTLQDNTKNLLHKYVITYKKRECRWDLTFNSRKRLYYGSNTEIKDSLVILE